MRTAILTSILAAALTAAACSDAEPEASATGAPTIEASGPALTGRDAVYAAAGQSPEAFVRAIYAQYVAGGPTGATPTPGRDPIFSRTMNALIGADVRAANGEVPSLNYDPFCGCQDQDAFALTAVAVAQSGPSAAEAQVTFTNGGQAQTRTLKLVKEGPNWKVDDIAEPEGSLHDRLMRVAEAAG